MDIKKRVEKLRRAIEKAAIKYGLNLTIYDGKLGFVDQEQKKIVALWNSNYKLEEEGSEIVGNIYDNPELLNKG